MIEIEQINLIFFCFPFCPLKGPCQRARFGVECRKRYAKMMFSVAICVQRACVRKRVLECVSVCARECMSDLTHSHACKVHSIKRSPNYKGACLDVCSLNSRRQRTELVSQADLISFFIKSYQQVFFRKSHNSKKRFS